MYKFIFTCLLLVSISACQLNPFGSRDKEDTPPANAIDIDADARTSIDINADAKKSEAPIDWRNSSSYRQWKNVRDGVQPNNQANFQEYQEYLQWLEFQKLKNQTN